jgi:uncharacterized protein with PQ loop repeat
MVIGQIIKFLPDLAMVFGGVLPYVPQYGQIKQTKSTGSFSTHVCLVLLLANSMRIFFRYGEVYEDALLMQSIVMIIAMIILTELCVRTNRFKESKQHRIFEFDPTYLWQWSNFIDYLIFLTGFWLVLTVITFLASSSALYFTILGSLSLGTESMLAAPQFFKNLKNQSTQGMSIFMVLGWLGGDLFKVIYFYVLSQPFQFLFCGIIQVSIDCLIMGQVFYYAKTEQKYQKIDTDELTAVNSQNTLNTKNK